MACIPGRSPFGLSVSAASIVRSSAAAEEAEEIAVRSGLNISSCALLLGHVAARSWASSSLSLAPSTALASTSVGVDFLVFSGRAGALVSFISLLLLELSQLDALPVDATVVP